MSGIFWLLSAYGLCFGLMNDKIPLVRRLRSVQFFNSMLDCAYCTGFYSGCAVVALVTLNVDVRQILLWGFAGAAFCYIVDSIVNLVEHLAVEENA